MGQVPADLAAELRDQLRLRRAVETGTYSGEGARRLAAIFDSAVTIELSRELWESARRSQADVPNLELRHGHSSEELPAVVDPSLPTLYFLDGHWSGGPTAGEEQECPVLDELQAISAGHPDDCIFIDDARLFTAPPPPPHDPRHWPTLIEVIDAIRAARPDNHVTVLADQVIGVPKRAKPAVDRFGQRISKPPEPSLVGRVSIGVTRALRRLRPRGTLRRH
jgi:hypothetical protein